MLSSPSGPRHIFQWASKFTREVVRSSLRGEVHALSETAGHKALLREFYPAAADVPPGMVGAEDCESLFTHSSYKKNGYREVFGAPFLGIQ